MRLSNVIKISCLVIIVGLLGFLCVELTGDAPERPEQPISPEEITGKGYQTPVTLAGTATTSPEFLSTSSPSIIKSFAIGPAVDQVDPYIWVSPSSTEFLLNVQVHYSLDGIDWYGQGHASSTAADYSITQHDTSTTTEQWRVGETTFRKLPPITDINAKYIKFTFTRGTVNWGGAIYSVALIKSTY